MKKTILFMTLLLMAVKPFSQVVPTVFMQTNTSSQTVTNPIIEKSQEKALSIKSIVTTDAYTQIDFVYLLTESQNLSIYLNPSGHKDAYYISINGKHYKLLSTQNIANTPDITFIRQGVPYAFSARFERIPDNTLSFDLLEGSNGTWDFIGVQLKSATKPVKVERFRRDYNSHTVFNAIDKAWGAWQSGNDTFIFNINDKGDLSHLKANGETVTYTFMGQYSDGKTDKGDHYQRFAVKGPDGSQYTIELFDQASIGLQMSQGSTHVQYATK